MPMSNDVFSLVRVSEMCKQHRPEDRSCLYQATCSRLVSVAEISKHI